MTKVISRISPWTLLLVPAALPLFIQDSYIVHGLLCRIMIFALLVIALDWVMGFIGDISLAHVGFFGIGAYTVAILTTTPALNESAELTMKFMPGWPVPLALIVAVALTSAFGLVLAFPTLRLMGDYLAVTTLSCGLIVQTLLVEAENITNGTKGIRVAPLSFFGITFDHNQFYYCVYPVLALVTWMTYNFANSYWARALQSLKSSQIAALCCGISRSRFKIITFVCSAGLAGLAGGLFPFLDHYVNANSFSVDLSLFCIMALTLGGIRSPLGCFLGMTVFVVVPDLWVYFKDYRLTMFGVLLLATQFWFPHGLVGIARSVWNRQFSKSRAAKQLRELKEQATAHLSPILNKLIASEAGPALEIENLHMRFGGLVALDSLSIRVPQGQIHGLMGPNGSGKTTALNSISGIYPPAQGSLKVFGQTITSWPVHRRAKIGIARTFQNLLLFSDSTVLDNVLSGFHLSFRSPLVSVLLRLPSAKREERELRIRAFRLLEFVGLADFAFERAGDLSHGQARHLSIARALAANPRLLLLDEPAAGLNPTEVRELNELILKIKSFGVTTILIEHHMDMILNVCDQITVLNFGKKIASGTPSEIEANPAVIEAYLGPRHSSPMGVTA